MDTNVPFTTCVFKSKILSCIRSILWNNMKLITKVYPAPTKLEMANTF